jgi:four helix bundle protein
MEKTNFSPYINTDTKYIVNIDDLAFDFAKKIVLLRKQLMSSIDKEYIISKQLVRSGTSIAANIAEANHPQSDADYVSKMNIALKEANESKLWIRLLKECNYITDNEYELLLFDCEKIIKIIFTITQKVKKRLNKK